MFIFTKEAAVRIQESLEKIETSILTILIRQRIFIINISLK